MSRKSAEEKVPTSTQSEDIHGEWMSIGQNKKKTDWNEYIDLEEDQGNVELDENEEGKGKWNESVVKRLTLVNLSPY